jgi:hypothetical protein
MYIHKHVTANNLKLKPYPFIREIAMEAYLVENEEVLTLAEGFESVEIIDCEIALKDSGVKDGSDGRVDVVLKYNPDYMAIAELKLDTLKDDHLKQLTNYLDKRQELLDLIRQRYPDAVNQDDNTEQQWQPQWVGVLVGTGIEPSLAESIRNGLYHNDIPIAALVINRYRGADNNIYVVTDTYFTNFVRGRDYTKYRFKDQCYGKSRLVQSVVRDYVLNNPNVTYIELEQIFPKNLQGSMGVFTDINTANSYKGKRFFTNPSELILLGDGSVIAVCNQWGDNTERFVKHVNQRWPSSIDVCS